MESALRKALSNDWATYKNDEEAAFAVLRRQFPEVDRTKFHDEFAAVQATKLTAAEKLGEDVKKPESRIPKSEVKENTAGGQGTRGGTANATSSSGEGSPKP